MTAKTIWELIGYCASLLVLISLLMTSLVKLRVLNMIGSFIFAIYALAIGSYPTAIMNFCLVIINIYFLLRIKKAKKNFALLPVALDDAYFLHFLQFYRQDIRTYFPDFDPKELKADAAWFVYCDAVAAGLLLGRELEDGTLEVVLDYSAPQYRDFSVGRYLYRTLPEQGCRRLVVRTWTEKHESYLKKMGFTRTGDSYVKELAGDRAPV